MKVFESEMIFEIFIPLNFENHNLKELECVYLENTGMRQASDTVLIFNLNPHLLIIVLLPLQFSSVYSILFKTKQ